MSAGRPGQVFLTAVTRGRWVLPGTSSLIAPPALPADRALALRQAFDNTMKDPEFLAEAKQRLLDVNPMSGTEIQKLISELYQTPPEIIALYLHAFSDMNETRWANLDALLQNDARLRLVRGKG